MRSRGSSENSPLIADHRRCRNPSVHPARRTPRRPPLIPQNRVEAYIAHLPTQIPCKADLNAFHASHLGPTSHTSGLPSPLLPRLGRFRTLADANTVQSRPQRISRLKLGAHFAQFAPRKHARLIRQDTTPIHTPHPCTALPVDNELSTGRGQHHPTNPVPSYGTNRVAPSHAATANTRRPRIYLRPSLCRRCHPQPTACIRPMCPILGRPRRRQYLGSARPHPRSRTIPLKPPGTRQH